MPQGRGWKDSQGRMVLMDDEWRKERSDREAEKKRKNRQREAWIALQYLTTWRDGKSPETLEDAKKTIMSGGPSDVQGDRGEEYKKLYQQLWKEEEARRARKAQAELLGVLMNPQEPARSPVGIDGLLSLMQGGPPRSPR